ncbi:MAG: protein kinase, partial [Planctomycetes bacterium]|nr:protein kinase [Planctomycetota bacterium]
MQVGPYRIVREVARGGMGVVYEAVDADGQAVAVKLLLEQRAQDPRTRKRFLTEIQALARLRHPNLVPILGAGEHDGVPWFALDYVEGESLQARLRRGPLPIQEALRVGQQLAQALAYVHGCGVLHRDLKPDNVLLQGDQALLTDFGLARDDDTQLSRITRSGQFLGTPGYWPPEQARGELDAVGPHSDVYGLGGVIYACLTGRPPVEASGLAESINLTVRGRITPARELRPDTPAWLDALCSRCLATDPAQRPASAEEVARALVSAPRDVPARSDRRVWITLATVACLALGSLGLAAWLWSQRGPTPVTAERARAARSWLLQAQGEAAAKRFAPARAAVERALELDPGLTAAYLLRATLRREADDPAGALADLGQAAQLGSDDAADHVGLGEAYAELGDATAALTA